MASWIDDLGRVLYYLPDIVVLTLCRLSSTLKRADSLRWTAHMQECLTTIERQLESPLDELLVTQVKMQLVADRCASLASGDAHLTSNPSLYPPPGLIAFELLSQLDQFKSAMPNTPSQDGKLVP